MGIRWKTFEMPKRLEVEQASLTPNYGKFIAEPFERGYGTTIGNALRRVLISSIEGAAVTIMAPFPLYKGQGSPGSLTALVTKEGQVTYVGPPLN